MALLTPAEAENNDPFGETRRLVRINMKWTGKGKSQSCVATMIYSDGYEVQNRIGTNDRTLPPELHVLEVIRRTMAQQNAHADLLGAKVVQ